MAENSYIAVTGDIVDSRGVPDAERVAIQRASIEAVESLSREFRSFLMGTVRLTAGDEFQALFVVAHPIVDFMRALTERLARVSKSNLPLGFGIGMGPLSTGVMQEARSIEHYDGPCFHRARAGIRAAKKGKLWAVFRGFGTTNDRTLTALFGLMGAVRSGWTNKQLQYSMDWRRLQKQIAVARKHDKSPSVITESLQQALAKYVREGELAAIQILKDLDLNPERKTSYE